LLVVVVIFQNWGKIERVLNPSGSWPSRPGPRPGHAVQPPSGAGTASSHSAGFSIRKASPTRIRYRQGRRARKAYEALGGAGFRFVDVNGTLIRDFKPDAILAALKP
jgi:mycoredoxin